MLADVLTQLYERDLSKLKTELSAYASETDMWRTSGEVANSAGNLALHLCGNLNHFLGTVLSGTAYVRDRDLEFSSEAVPREKILADIDSTIEVVTTTLKNLSEEDFAKIYPVEVFGHPMTTGYFLVHLATHLTYHLGQINYHRRMLA